LTSKGGEDFEKPQWAIFQQPRFTLIRAEDWSDNLLVEQKQMVRLQFWLWVLVVAVAAFFWPWGQVLVPASPASSTPTSLPAQ
jgi:hypothetical protein